MNEEDNERDERDAGRMISNRIDQDPQLEVVHERFDERRAPHD